MLAVENLEGSLSLNSMFNVSGSTFCLKVEGDSMRDAGILDGDFVIVESGAPVRNKAIAAVLLGDEATVKRVCFEGRTVRLKGENPDFEDILVRRDSPELRICGPVQGVIRKL